MLLMMIAVYGATDDDDDDELLTNKINLVIFPLSARLGPQCDETSTLLLNKLRLHSFNHLLEQWRN